MFSGRKSEEEAIAKIDEAINVSSEQQVADDMFKAISGRCGKLFTRKNTQYGNAIQSTGVIGAVVELIGGVARLRKMVLQSPTHGEGDDKLIDVLRDINVYSNIAMQMMADENWVGK